MLTIKKAFELIRSRPGASEWFAPGEDQHAKKAFRFEFVGPMRRQMALDRVATNRVGISVYVNAVAVDGVSISKDLLREGGIAELKFYPRGHKGKNGNPGISRAVTPAPTLNPATNDVYHLHVPDEASLSRLFDWYCSSPGSSAGDTAEADPLERAINRARSLRHVDDVRILRAIKTRRGQPSFRRDLLEAYGGKCCVTGCRTDAVLEAAHILPHSRGTDYAPSNGLLLRADVHTLFDLNLIGIDDSYRVVISESLEGSEYAAFNGKPIMLPSAREKWPSKAALRGRRHAHPEE